ncbi:MAG: hypothetical protein LBJ08_12735 [Bifidobacteriaceae bacterium]|jgi:hypothetical protein|nr:hypothetical protein [Bifidobacteriaceae bacterium]
MLNFPDDPDSLVVSGLPDSVPGEWTGRASVTLQEMYTPGFRIAVDGAAVTATAPAANEGASVGTCARTSPNVPDLPSDGESYGTGEYDPAYDEPADDSPVEEQPVYDEFGY